MIITPEETTQATMIEIAHVGICHGGGAAGGSAGGGFNGGTNGGVVGGPGGGGDGGGDGGSDGWPMTNILTAAVLSNSTGTPISALSVAGVRLLRPRWTAATPTPLPRVICALTVTLDAATVSSISVAFTPGAYRESTCRYAAASKLSRVVLRTAVIETTLRYALPGRLGG